MFSTVAKPKHINTIATTTRVANTVIIPANQTEDEINQANTLITKYETCLKEARSKDEHCACVKTYFNMFTKAGLTLYQADRNEAKSLEEHQIINEAEHTFLNSHKNAVKNCPTTQKII